MLKVIMYSAQDCTIFKNPVAEQILESLQGCAIEGFENIYKVDQILYLKVREKIPFFQQQPMLVNFFTSNYDKKIVVEQMEKIDDEHMMNMMLLVEQINQDEPTR